MFFMVMDLTKFSQSELRIQLGTLDNKIRQLLKEGISEDGPLLVQARLQHGRVASEYSNRLVATLVAA
jgi:hypothetical protein